MNDRAPGETLPPVSPIPGVAEARAEALRAHAAMILFAAAIAGSFTLGGMAAPLIAPEALTALRFLIATGVMAAICAGQGKLRRSDLVASWRYGVIGALLATYFILMFVALAIASPVSLSAVFTLNPALAALFGWLLLRQVTTPRMALSIAVAGAGALWVIFRGDVDAILRFDLGAGEAIFFVGCVAHGAYPAVSRLLQRGETVTGFTFWVIVAAFALICAWAMATGALVATDWGDLPAIVWVCALYTGVFATAGTIFLVQYAARRLPSSKVMAYGYLTPCFVILLEGIAGHGWAPPQVIVGAVVVLGGLLVLMLSRD